MEIDWSKSPFEGLLPTPEWFIPIEKAIYQPVHDARAVFDRPADQAYYMVASGFSLICCLMLPVMPGGPTFRKIFSTSVGLFIQFFCFGKATLVGLGINSISYLTMLVAPSRYQHIIIFAVSGLMLCFSQIHRQIYAYGDNGLDCIVNLMFNFCRVSALACCIHDGRIVKEAKKKGEKPDLKKRELYYAVEETPSILDFFSYLHFCGAAISGPFYEFKDFQQMMAREGPYSDVPSTIRPALVRFSHAWINVLLGNLLGDFEEEFMLTPEFLEGYGFFQKLGYAFITVKQHIFTYQVGWCLMEAGPIGSGLSYNGKDEVTGEHKWDKVQTVNIWNMETLTKVKDIPYNWNISVHVWLKNYIFLRQLPNGKRGNPASANAITFAVSSIWHGFYPGFFVFFVFAGMADYQAKLASEAWYPLIAGWCPQWLINITCYVWVYSFLSYASIAHFLLSWEKFHKVYSTMFYALHFVMVGATLLAYLMKPKKKKSDVTPDEKKRQ